MGSKMQPLREQRRAIHAFLAAQRAQGWVRLRPSYEDIGHSAGTLKRPALTALLADIDTGKVDCVVACDLARLTRSHADRLALLARFRRAGASLVTVQPLCFDALEIVGWASTDL